MQALQIVRGGREPELRARGTLPALAAIDARGLLPADAVAALRDAYVFLRQVEHRLQYRDDRQTQTLPADAAECDALARTMGCADGAAFDQALAAHRAAVSAQFASLFGAGGDRDPADTTASSFAAGRSPALPALAALWAGDVSAETARQTLAAAGFADPEGLLANLTRVRAGSRYVQLPALSRQRVDALVPQLLAAAAMSAEGADAQAVFLRLFELLEAVSRRSAYLALLTEHPTMLPRLAQLMGASQWAADYLTRHPILLDELLDPRVLLAEPDWEAWRGELARLLAIQAGDVEEQMDVLRQFKHAQSFRLLAQDLAGTLTSSVSPITCPRSPMSSSRRPSPRCGRRCRARRRRRRSSRSSASASSAARSWATRPISTSSSSTTTPTTPDRSATCASRGASSPGSPA